MNATPTATLFELCEIRSGGTPLRSNSTFYDGVIPWAKIGDLDTIDGKLIKTEECITDAGLRSIRGTIFEAGTLLFAIYGSIGKMAFAAHNVSTNQAILGINVRDPAKLAYRFLYHFLLFRNPQFQADGQGIAQKNLSAAYLRNLQIPLPPISEQRRIAAILDKADALRRKRKRTLELLSGLKQAIFVEMFGNPIENSLKLDIASLGALNVEMVYGPRFYNEQYHDDGIRIVRITDLNDSGKLNYDMMPKIKISDEDLEAYKSRPGEILFARTGATVGKTALVRAGDPVTIPGAYFIRLRFPDHINPVYAFEALRNNTLQKIISEGSRQSAQQNFSGPGLRRLPIALPSKSLQDSFEHRCTLVDDNMIRMHTQSKLHDALFASLQHRAFTGQL